MKVKKRLWMIERREMMGYTLRQMADKVDCSELLLGWVEKGFITHPNIAARIAACYGMNVDGFNQLVSEKKRRKCLPVPKKRIKRGGKRDR